MPAAFAGIGAGGIDNQRIDRDTLSAESSTGNGASRLMTENQGRRAAAVMAMIGMHVRAADTDSLDLDNDLAGRSHGLRLITVNEAVRAGIDKCFHGCRPSIYFAVNPPSTASVWPVT